MPSSSCIGSRRKPWKSYASIAAHKEPKLRQSEIERAIRKPTDSLDAYGLYLRALAASRKLTEQGFANAIALLKKALAIDPSNAPAAAMISWCRDLQRLQGWGPITASDDAEAVILARQAIEVGNADPDALTLSAVTLFYAGDPATAFGAVERALSLNPNSALAWCIRGGILGLRNEPNFAIEAVQRAMRLSPFDPQGYLFTCCLAIAHLAARHYEEAIEWADRSLRQQPRFLPSISTKAVSCAHLGRIEEAQDCLRRRLELQPGLTLAKYQAYVGFAFAPEIRGLYLEGLRKAGLPEE